MSLVRNFKGDDPSFTKEEIDTTVEEIRIRAFRPALSVTPSMIEIEHALIGLWRIIMQRWP